jgi:hypothetical protein
VISLPGWRQALAVLTSLFLFELSLPILVTTAKTSGGRRLELVFKFNSLVQTTPVLSIHKNGPRTGSTFHGPSANSLVILKSQQSSTRTDRHRLAFTHIPCRHPASLQFHPSPSIFQRHQPSTTFVSLVFTATD